jgi:hypothetical protein
MFYVETNLLMNNNFFESKGQSPHTRNVYMRDNHPIGFYNLKILTRSTRFVEVKKVMEGNIGCISPWLNINFRLQGGA